MADTLYIHSKPYFEQWLSEERPDKSRTVRHDRATDKLWVTVGGVEHQLIVHDKMPVDQIEPSPPTEKVLAADRRHREILAEHRLNKHDAVGALRRQQDADRDQ